MGAPPFGHSSQDEGMMSGVNVTPLVDVMVVPWWCSSSPALAGAPDAEDQPGGGCTGQHRVGTHVCERYGAGRDVARTRGRPAVPVADRSRQRGPLWTVGTVDGAGAACRVSKLSFITLSK